jgi:hypothetical protein
MVARGWISSSVTMLTFVSVAVAAPPPQPKNVTRVPPPPVLPAVVGATETMKLVPPFGYLDEPVAVDGGRIAYVVSDSSTKSEIHVVHLGCAACVEQHAEIVADISAFTLHPIGLRLVGNRAFVIGATDDGGQIAALVELGPMPPAVAPVAPPAAAAPSPAAPPAAAPAPAATATAAAPTTPVATPAAAKPAPKAPKGKAPGTIVYKLGPATHITVIARDKQTRVAVHKATPTEKGARHTVDLVAIETGRKVSGGKAFELEGAQNKKLELTVNHWMEGYTKVGGIKGGEWSKKENQRSPDVEAVYDLVAGKLVETRPITDLFEQRKRFQLLADAGNGTPFLRPAWDNQSIQLWKLSVGKTLELDQPIGNYDLTSLQATVLADGSAWFALKVDPVNADAVARKKADPEYLDVFHAGTDGKAVRKARVLAKGIKHRFGVAGDSGFWLVERSPGFDRGGTKLATYTIAP